MRFWPLFGITRLLTERRIGKSDRPVRSLPRIFRRSLHIYVVDVGNSHALNLEVAAMKAAQYNIHRYGIFFADSPRHADLLLVLGSPLPTLWDAFRETLNQLPRPFGVLWIREGSPSRGDQVEQGTTAALIEECGGSLIAETDDVPGPGEIISLLRAAMAKGEVR